TVTITNLLNAGQETLAATPSGAIVAGDITYSSATGILTITRSAPLADYQAVLRSVTYSDNSPAPNTTARVIRFVADDAALASANAAKPVTVTAVNNAPVVPTTGGTTAFTENGPAAQVDSGLAVTDADSPNLASATVTITNLQNGVAESLSFTPS